MTRSKFYRHGDRLIGFCIEGHTGFGIAGEDIVCAAVSSAAYMAANTITEVCGCTADITVNEGCMRVSVPPTQADKCQSILAGLQLHMQLLQEQYADHIEVTITEGISHAEH